MCHIASHKLLLGSYLFSKNFYIAYRDIILFGDSQFHAANFKIFVQIISLIQILLYNFVFH